ncbi:Wall-associated receptor kinase-like 15 [Nymphaea thermarum]|nr:Wall-associated receptor kinase-like 15 [Nymphaea thermarum]
MEVGRASIRCLPSLGISIFWLTILHLLICSAGKQCGNCGSFSVPYPLSTSPGCGDPSYSVFCNTSAGALFLRSEGGADYPITSIDPLSQTFILQPAELCMFMEYFARRTPSMLDMQERSGGWRCVRRTMGNCVAVREPDSDEEETGEGEARMAGVSLPPREIQAPSR